MSLRPIERRALWVSLALHGVLGATLLGTSRIMPPVAHSVAAPLILQLLIDDAPAVRQPAPRYLPSTPSARFSRHGTQPVERSISSRRWPETTASQGATATSATTPTPAPVPAQAAASGEPDTPASFADNPPPVYPALLRERGIEGTVWLKVHVNAGGQVTEVIIGKSSGFRLLDQAAVDAVRQWHFSAARHGVRTVASWVGFPLNFRLDG